MKPTSNNIAGVILAGLWLTSATVVRAATTATLDFLQGTPGSELTIGNLVFYNFSLPAQTPFTVDLSHITVEAYQDAGTLDYGIRFDSAEFGKFIMTETVKWGKVIKAAHIKVE